MNDLLTRRRVVTGLGLLSLGLIAGCDPGSGLSYKYGKDLSNEILGRKFKLRDAQGNEMMLGSFRGMMPMIFFGFTQCPAVCPTALARAAQAKKKPMQQRRQPPVIHLQPGAVERLADQTAVAQRNAQQRQAGDAADKERRVAIHRQNRTEQQVQQIDAGAAQRDQRDAKGQRAEVKPGKTGVLFQRRSPADPPRHQRHRDPGDKSANAHRQQRHAVKEITRRHSRQNGVRQRIAHQAHSSQQQ